MSHLLSFLVVEAIGEVYIMVEQGGLGGSGRDDGHLEDGLRSSLVFSKAKDMLRTVSLSSSSTFILAAACDCAASPADTILVM